MMQAYAEMTLKDGPAKGSGAKESEPVVKKTGKTETILGYRCEQILITHGGKETEVWATKGLGRFIQLDPGGGTASAWERELASGDMFPLRVIEKDAKGKRVSAMEVTAVEKKSLSDSLFKVPANFNKLDIPMMGRPDH
jgi:hypothetical protein